MAEEKLTRIRKLRLHVFSTSVQIELCCQDEYEAQVIFDDLEQRMKAGEKICIDTLVHAGSGDR